MRTLLLLTILFCVTFTLIAQNTKDKESVKEVILLFQEDFNDGQFKNASNYTTTDWEHINPNGGITKGRDNVLKEARKVHQLFLKGVTIKIESMEIRFLSSTVALADVVHSIDNYVTPDGKKHINEKQIKTYVLVKQSDKWLLTHDHNTIIIN